LLCRFRAVCGDEHLLHAVQSRTRPPFGNPATARRWRTDGTASTMGDA
jgi:hypothetical protein